MHSNNEQKKDLLVSFFLIYYLRLVHDIGIERNKRLQNEANRKLSYIIDIASGALILIGFLVLNQNGFFQGISPRNIIIVGLMAMILIYLMRVLKKEIINLKAPEFSPVDREVSQKIIEEKTGISSLKNGLDIIALSLDKDLMRYLDYNEFLSMVPYEIKQSFDDVFINKNTDADSLILAMIVKIIETDCNIIVTNNAWNIAYNATINYSQKSTKQTLEDLK